MPPHVYIETSIISYLTARTSRNVVVAGRQQLTRIWWRGRKGYTLCTTELVIEEASGGDPRASARRLRALRKVVVFGSTVAAHQLAYDLVRQGALPAKAADDALHVAIAAVYNVDFLLTWNCKHIANAALRGTIEEICRSSGFRPPSICTPDELPFEAPR